jgi:hypothetical protein
MATHLTTQELEAARTKYRGEIIPADALSVMDAEAEALRAEVLQLFRSCVKTPALAILSKR